jgi:hypothetical protein
MKNEAKVTLTSLKMKKQKIRNQSVISIKKF